MGLSAHVSERLYCVSALKAMTIRDWFALPVVRVSVFDLIPTQEGLSIDRLIALTEGGSREGDDPYGHVVLYNNKYYIHDGHHQWALAWLRGEPTVPVRVRQIDMSCVEPCFCYKEASSSGGEYACLWDSTS